MGSHFLRLYTSLQTSRNKRLTTYFYPSLRRYSPIKEENESILNPNGYPETAEELEKEIEEIEDFDEAKAKQGFASQSLEKLQDGVEEAAMGKATVESVNEKTVEPPSVGDLHKSGHNDDKGVLER